MNAPTRAANSHWELATRPALLFNLGFYSFRRFALVDDNEGFFLTRLKSNANPLIVGERRKWRGRAISLPERRLLDVLDDPTREIIDVTAEIDFKRRAYAGKQVDRCDGVPHRWCSRCGHRRLPSERHESARVHAKAGRGAVRVAVESRVAVSRVEIAVRS